MLADLGYVQEITTFKLLNPALMLRENTYLRKQQTNKTLYLK